MRNLNRGPLFSTTRCIEISDCTVVVSAIRMNKSYEIVTQQLATIIPSNLNEVFVHLVAYRRSSG